MKLPAPLLALFLLLISSLAYAWRPHSILVLGDSLSDNGNKYQLYAIPISPPYWYGRYSNGPIWVENLAFQFNLIPNPLTRPDYDRHAKLENYAMGDSVVSEKDLSAGTKTRTLLEQLKLFQQQKHENPHHTLAIVWDGANDFKNPACITHPFVCTKTMIHTEVKVINALYDAGIRHFVIPTLPNLTVTPAMQAAPPKEKQVIRGLIKYYNNNLALAISQLQLEKNDIHILKFNTNAFMNETRPYFKQGGQSACYDNHDIYTKKMGEPCPPNVQNDYFFWDNMHPTTAAHSLLANHIYDQIRTAEW